MSKKSTLIPTLVISALLASPGHSAAGPAKRDKGVTAGKVLAQSLGGIGAGLVGGLAGWGVGSVAGTVFGDKGKSDGFWISPAYVWGFYGAFAGYAAGTATGISLVGHKQGLDGSPILTAVGNLAGQALALWLRADMHNSALEGSVLFAIPMGLSLAAYDGSHWARHRSDGVSAGMDGGAPPSMGARPYRLEVVKFTF